MGRKINRADWKAMVARAAEIGTVHGQATATWYEIPDMASAVWVIMALEDIDPLVYDTFATPPTGEWSGDYTTSELLRELEPTSGVAVDELWDVYTDAWREAYEEEISRYAHSFM